MSDPNPEVRFADPVVEESVSEETPADHSEEEEDVIPTDMPTSGLASLFQNAFGGGGGPEHELDDPSLLAAYYREVLGMSDDEEEPEDGDEPDVSESTPRKEKSSGVTETPHKYDITAFVLSKYRDAGVKIYPEEIKAQVRMLILAYHTEEDPEDPALDPVMVRLVKDIWSE